jgi:translation initiation factor 3 subunit G
MNTVRVSNLSEDCTEQEIRDLFEQCGSLGRVFIARDHDTGRGKGFAFVTYRDQESADIAIKELDGTGMNYLILSVERSRPSTNK